MRIAVIGATGQLGAELVTALAGHELLALGHDQIEIADPGSVARALDPFRPQWLVSTAAFHDVERCETEPERALSTNARGAGELAAAAARLGARLLHVSTDYVFSGRKGAPYVESDAAEPLNTYGATKLAGEALARVRLPGALIVRTSAVYGPHPCRGKGGRNFVDLMLRLGRERGKVRVVDDETVSPSYAPHLARGLAGLIRAGTSGTVHLAGSGQATWFELAREIFAGARLEVTLERAAPGEFAGKTPRPAYSGLASERLPRELALPDWREGLAEYLALRAPVKA